MKYFRRSTCRLCDSPKLERVLHLQPSPPANAWCAKERLQEQQASYPLDIYKCAVCHHVQLVDVLDPLALFGDYVYVSGTSPIFVTHLQQLARHLCERFHLGAEDFVLEIGSNDGTLLKEVQQLGPQVLGIDPAGKIAAQAVREGVPTWPRFFDAGLVPEIRSRFGPAAIVVANNVFAHIDDLRGCAHSVRAALADDGVFVFEVSYLSDVIRDGLFDTIYHEHLSYHSLLALRPFFASLEMELFDAERVNTHGGSLRCFVQKNGGSHHATGAVDKLIEQELRDGLDSVARFDIFAREIANKKKALRERLLQLKAMGKRIAGFGAPAKATTLMHHFSIGADILDFIVDDSPWKQGLYSPGFHVPVLPAAAIAERKPNYLLILAWNFADSIIAKNKGFLDGGGRFIIPLPELREVGCA